MRDEIHWDPDAIAYIRSRGNRYPGGMDIEPEWTQEVTMEIFLPSNQTRSHEWGPRGSSAAPDPQGEWSS